MQVPPELPARRKEPGAHQESPSAAPALQPPHFCFRSVFAFDFFFYSYLPVKVFPAAPRQLPPGRRWERPPRASLSKLCQNFVLFFFKTASPIPFQPPDDADNLRGLQLLSRPRFLKLEMPRRGVVTSLGDGFGVWWPPCLGWEK